MNIFKKITATVALAASLALSGTATAEEIVVGGKNFTEQQLLTSLTTQYLEAKGYQVKSRAGMGSGVLRSAQESGQIDLYWEYTGTGLIVYHNVKEKLGREEGYQRIKELDAEKGLVWLKPSDANNTYAIAMREKDAEKRGIETLSELADTINSGDNLRLASNAEWYARADGFRPFAKKYGFKLPRAQILRMDTGLTYTALKEGEVDLALVFATDGRIRAFDFVVLEDDKGFFPDYAITPVVRAETLEKHPELEEQMNTLSALIDNEVMKAMNARVDVDREAISAVARDFLEQHDLI